MAFKVLLLQPNNQRISSAYTGTNGINNWDDDFLQDLELNRARQVMQRI